MSEAGQERKVAAVEGRDAMREAMQQVIGSARRSLLILSQGLNAAFYKDPAFIECFKTQLLNERRLQVKLIISDPAAAAKQAETFIQLTRRLTSQFIIREPEARKHRFEDECMIADHKAYVFRSLSKSRIAKFSMNDPVGAHGLNKRFDDYWQHSQPCTEFRQLGV